LSSPLGYPPTLQPSELGPVTSRILGEYVPDNPESEGFGRRVGANTSHGSRAGRFVGAHGCELREQIGAKLAEADELSGSEFTAYLLAPERMRYLVWSGHRWILLPVER
jgi:hypothetical protein